MYPERPAPLLAHLLATPEAADLARAKADQEVGVSALLVTAVLLALFLAFSF